MHITGSQKGTAFDESISELNIFVPSPHQCNRFLGGERLGIFFFNTALVRASIVSFEYKRTHKNNYNNYTNTIFVSMAPARYCSDGKLDWRKVAIEFGRIGSPFIRMIKNPAKPGEYLICNVHIHSPEGVHWFSSPICTSTLGTHPPDPLVQMGLRHTYNWDTNGSSL
jgi:hypothetical protein